MTSALPFADGLCFIVFPYLAMFVFFLGTIMRYRKAPFTYSSFSTQFLENKQHFWGLVPFHYGIVAVLLGHIVAFLIPREILVWNSRPLRLYVLEISALIFGLLTLVGLIGAIHRRLTFSKVRAVTTVMDWVVFVLLLAQVVSGVYVAVFHPWGSSWFAATVAPYLWSLVRFNPDLGFIAMMPLIVKFHIVMAYTLIAVAPFTRLVHILVAPNPYFWRKNQVVRWYRAPNESL
ncbi:MAG TPA: respiratory nitrate reductase subunit gamma [Terriglobales bacterium]|nr:respiratory nitrate reductase subunit gamma [Terriglobales bacterium]